MNKKKDPFENIGTRPIDSKNVKSLVKTLQKEKDRFGVLIDADLKEELHFYAIRQKSSMSAIINQLLKDHFEKEKSKNKST